MEKKLIQLTDKEKTYVAEEMGRIVRAAKTTDIRRAMLEAALAHGCSETDAAAMIDSVISNVDAYIDACGEAFRGDLRTWIAGKITASMEEQELTEREATAYKLGVLQAVRGINAGAVNAEGPLLTEEEQALLEAGSLTPEQNLELDELLLDSLENNAMPLYMTAAFEEFLDSRADGDQVDLVVSSLWKERNMKYAASAALVLANRDGKLLSVPGDTPEAALILGACQGLDVMNIEAQVSRGELAADKAYEIIKIIGAVVLTTAAVILISMFAADVGAFCSMVAFEVLGTGFLGFLAMAGIWFYMMMVVCSDETADVIVSGMELVGEGADKAYEALKKAAKKLYRCAQANLIPTVKAGLERVEQFFRTAVDTVRRFLKNGTTVSAKA